MYERNLREIEKRQVYYRKQVQLPIIERGAKDTPFIRSEVYDSDKVYYRNRFANPVIVYGMNAVISYKGYYVEMAKGMADENGTWENNTRFRPGGVPAGGMRKRREQCAAG